MFSKLLIANRGEIACRVIATARRMGVRTVAVFSEADRGARHVRLADEAVLIGPPPARESYLDIARILEAAQSSGAEAIHPGYGFLSENEHFADACAHAGVVFVGPPVGALRAMGSKAAAKALMQAAGVPLVPGYHGDDQDPGRLQAEADGVAYPVLIKPSAGGGGKGMHVVERSADFAGALAAAKREAASSFGDDRMIIEKYIARPRHIEIQVFGDTHGRIIHLFERDCSVQRRHQKVIEEAPAPKLEASQRRQMGEAAVMAARAVDYTGAGTVEFIAQADGEFFFMEMNTRLQVEHPVTEMITGLDLVEWQLRIAAGEALPLAQSEVRMRGHAIEARVYAEDPARGFVPSIGTLVHLAPPSASAHVRVDTGVEQGDEINPWYDPMIAKLIVWDETREAACARLLQALADYRIVGVASNIDFLARVVASNSFASAEVDTGLIEREREHLFGAVESPVGDQVLMLAALAELLQEKAAARQRAIAVGNADSPWAVLDGWRVGGHAERRLAFSYRDEAIDVAVVHGLRGYRLRTRGKESNADGELGERFELRAHIDDHRLDATVVPAGATRHVFVGGRHFELGFADPLHDAVEDEASEGAMIAPMPGRVVALLVAPGARVEKGTPLIILEAMKMEHTIVAPYAGTVRELHFPVGAQVSEGAELVALDRTHAEH